MSGVQVLIAFVVGVIVGLVVYIVSVKVPFLAEYAGLWSFLAFVLATYVTYRSTAPRV
jgi:predicted PurR-regulated permease PerM